MLYYIISLGCSKNQVDSEKVNGELISHGFTPASAPEDAELLIINTCGFIEDAKRESIDVIFDALSLREKARHAVKVAVCGCLSRRYMDELKSEIPEIDFCYGIADENFVPALCRSLGIAQGHGGPRQVPLVQALPYRYIKISEGCSNNCSYCAIPSIRGTLRPYPPSAVLEDARRAAAEGAKELVVIAQDTASYRYGDVRLAGLVSDLSLIDGVEWIRLLYCHPDHVNDSIIQLIAENDKVVKYIDLPFQHASGKVLRSMGRKGNRETYEALVRRLREMVPGIRIRSTFMVGYPGETEAEFSELMEFIAGAEIDRVGCFAYSPEEGTAAAGLAGQVTARIKKSRLAKLMRVQKKISAKKLKDMAGALVRVLVEEKTGDASYIGRTEYDAPEVDGIFYLTGGNCEVNTIVRARVTDSAEYDLFGVPA